MSRRVVDIINQFPERHRFVRGLRSWIGFPQCGYAYERSARANGTSKYSLSKLMGLAFDGIFTFSEKPLRWSTYSGCLVAALSLAWAVRTVLWRLFTNEELPGFATLAAGMFFLGAVQLISIGILGEYIGRIHNEAKGRPLYVVDRVCGSTLTQTATIGPEAQDCLRLEDVACCRS
jgi:dolichol-phosphate mannosyltransferase